MPVLDPARDSILAIAPWLEKYPLMLQQVKFMSGTDTDNPLTLTKAIMLDIGWLKPDEFPYLVPESLERAMQAHIDRGGEFS